MSRKELRHRLEALCATGSPDPVASRGAVDELLQRLECGEIRAAEPLPEGGWQVNSWVKAGILLGFRVGTNVSMGVPGGLPFRDRDTFPVWNPNDDSRDVRIVPGGSSVRRGAYLAEGVVVMPPAYVNVGAFVDRGTMVDSHALIGSCAQVGRNVHVSAAVQIGGVLEPVGARPVIVEDNCLLGGGCGIYEGTRVGARAVLAAGVILTRGTKVYDLVHERVIAPTANTPLEIPSSAVVVPGARPASGAFAEKEGIQLQTPVIVKYRDARTDAATALEEALR
jgi:2,3,4,5-tetrahydropyridine-2-carboxylate N-succinyltransferase